MMNFAAAKSIDLLALIEPTTRLRKVAAHEYAGACPKCGGKDRFRVDPGKGWFCRQCTTSEHWNDAVDFLMWYRNLDAKRALLQLLGKTDITPAELEYQAEQRRQRDAERAQAEKDGAAMVARKLNDNPDWKTYSENLNRYPEARQMWHDRGLPDEWIAYYGLGYCPAREFACGDAVYTAASLTIPYWRCDIGGEPGQGSAAVWRVINLKHRILTPDFPGGKYRPHLAGAGNNLFYTDPMCQHLYGTVLVVEGEIKAMVTWASMWEYPEGEPDLLQGATSLHVVGIPGKSWKPEWLAELATAERVIVCLDPDATADAERMAAAMGEKGSVLRLPDKIDDLINAEIIDGRGLLSALEVTA